MNDHPFAVFLFILANVTITAGYLYVAATVVPRVQMNLLRTKIGGVGFFVLCGITHMVMAVQTLTDSPMTAVMMASSWWSLAIHIPQAICVWLFVTGLYVEIGDTNASLRPRLRLRKDQ
mgnify:CR=1 FL=1